MTNLNLYSVDLSLWKESPFLSGRALDDITYDDWQALIKGLYDWIRKLQKAKGKKDSSLAPEVKELMYAYGKRRPLKFVLLTIISRFHKKKLEQHLSSTAYHAHMLVYGYKISVVVKLIKYYWASHGYARSVKDIHDIKCYDNGKLAYNLAQSDGKKPMICVSPAITAYDLKSMYYGEFASIPKNGDTHRISTNAIIKAIDLYGNILIKNGYSTTVRGRFLARVRAVKSH